MRLRFDENTMNAFRNLSGDENPLHLSEDYAKRTQFGERVVYGVSSVFSALGRWANGRSFELERIKAEFKKPLFFNQDYVLEATESGNQVILLIKMGPVVRTRVTLLLREASERFESGERSDLLKVFALESGQIPIHQLRALAWSSYIVGMDFPGKQGLYFSFDFTFDGDLPTESRFVPRELKKEFDERYNAATLKGDGPGVTKFSIVAVRRQEPVEYPIDSIAALVGRQPTLQNKTVLITGSARGFGAVLAKVLALRGANLVLNYRSDSKEFMDLQEEIKSASCPSPFLLRGDAGSRTDWEGMKEQLVENSLRLDWLVCNASPSIQPLLLSEQTSSKLVGSFVQKSLGKSGL